MQQLTFDRRKQRGLYALAAIVFVDPKIVLDADDMTPDTLYYRQLAWRDVLAAHAFFQYGPPRAFTPAEDTQPGVAAEADSVTPPAE